MTETTTQYTPLRLSKSREEYEANRADPARQDLGVSGSLYAGEEATVVISVGDDWHYMDVEYARLMIRLLTTVVKGADKHNRKLGLTPGA